MSSISIDTIDQAEKVLRSFVPNAKTYFKDGLSLERMWPMLKAVGNPHEKLKVIHIAGTSGKTSTCYYTAALLHASGKKVGLTVSPHVDSVRERAQVYGQPLSETDFCAYLQEFLMHIDESTDPSYFEVLLVFVLWVFVKQGVDYAVLETGLGGLLDSTNVVTRHDKVCVITDIGMDHMQILGSTIEQIASQKAGIIHESNHVIMYNQEKNITDVIDSHVLKKNASLDRVTPLANNESEVVSRLATYQQRNYGLALRVVEYVAKRDGFQLSKSFDPSTIIVPGRIEERELANGSILVMDGAHNEQKMNAFVSSFRDKYPGKKATILLALKEGKEYREVMTSIKPITTKLILTTFSGTQDLPTISQDPHIIAKYARSLALETSVFMNPTQAFTELTKNPDGLKVVTGSFYLLGQIRKLLV